MKLKERVYSILNYCQSNEIACAFWKQPQEDSVHGILSRSFNSRPYNLKEDEGFCLSLFDSNNEYILLKKNLAFKIDLKSKEITITANDNSVVSNDFFEDMSNSPLKRKTANKSNLISYSKDLFLKNVEQGINNIEIGTLDKVVVSKFKENIFEVWQAPYLFKCLYKDYKTAFVHMSYLPNNGLWIGATPETLLSYDNQTSVLKTVALAGTQKAKKTAPKEAVWKQKEIEEQALVSRYIINCFKKIRLREFRERGPKTIQAGNLWHLFTEFIVNNTEAKVKNLADKMLLLLHPTSAVCGMPLQEAKKFLLKKEQYRREFFTGFVGPVNMFSKTHLFVNLRCGKISEGKIRLFAGAGITEDSDSEKEWEETEMKCQIILDKIKQIEADAEYS